MGINKAIAITVLAGCAMHAAAQRPAQKSRPQSAADRAAQDRAADDLKDAESLLQKQQFPQAEERLQALVSKQADNPQVWFDLGFAQSHLGQFTEAITAYKKATELDPKWFEAQKNLGLALAKSGDLATAASSIQDSRYVETDCRWATGAGRCMVITGASGRRKPAAGIFGGISKGR